jgi:hypothetical protein
MDKIDILGILLICISLLYLTIYTIVYRDICYGIGIGIISAVFIVVILKSKKKINKTKNYDSKIKTINFSF